MSDFSAPTEVKCYWAPAAGAPLEPGKITRRAPTSRDVVIDVKYAGICHSDIHTVSHLCDDPSLLQLTIALQHFYRLVMNGLISGVMPPSLLSLATKSSVRLLPWAAK